MVASSDPHHLVFTASASPSYNTIPGLVMWLTESNTGDGMPFLRQAYKRFWLLSWPLPSASCLSLRSTWCRQESTLWAARGRGQGGKNWSLLSAHTWLSLKTAASVLVKPPDDCGFNSQHDYNSTRELSPEPAKPLPESRLSNNMKQ